VFSLSDVSLKKVYLQSFTLLAVFRCGHVDNVSLNVCRYVWFLTGPWFISCKYRFCACTM